MRNNQQRTLRKVLPDAPLYLAVRGHVQIACAFVENEDFGPRDQGARETDELALALGEVEAAAGDGVVKVVENSARWWRDNGGCVGRGLPQR